ncbi:ParB/RepB/Spo0J family partition protein [Streptomyces jumonjinensis]|uniref:ParB/RepB/Spo0J family partition protein n=1 Tax=Streptomyces jumonjinensis TaxID=1945 RepID=UPI00332B19A8
MSKASQLGSGASFQQARTVSPRRQAINDATKAPTTGTLPPVELPVDSISLNPANPRSELGDLTQLAGSLRDHGQKTAISIMSRFAYVEANPGQEHQLEPGSKYVVIDGNSRLAAAREAALPTIKVMLDEALGSNPDQILESALVANIHRQDLDHLDEARALEQLMKVHGTQEALAARLHRSQGWVSQRLALLTLTPELQRRLEAGEEPAELLRSVGRKKPEEQEAHLQRLKEKKRQSTAKKSGRPQTEPNRESPVDRQGQAESAQTAAVSAKETSDHYAVMNRTTDAPSTVRTGPATMAVPDPRAANDEPQIRMPWSDGAALMEAAFARLEPAQRSAFILHYFKISRGVDDVIADMRGTLTRQERSSLAAILQQVSTSLLADV